MQSPVVPTTATHPVTLIVTLSVVGGVVFLILLGAGVAYLIWRHVIHTHTHTHARSTQAHTCTYTQHTQHTQHTHTMYEQCTCVHTSTQTHKIPSSSNLCAGGIKRTRQTSKWESCNWPLLKGSATSAHRHIDMKYI